MLEEVLIENVNQYLCEHGVCVPANEKCKLVYTHRFTVRVNVFYCYSCVLTDNCLGVNVVIILYKLYLFYY